jgi:hypothetical protein
MGAHHPSQMGTHPSLDLSSFLLRTSPTGQPIYEEIPPSLCPLLPSSDSCSDYVDTTSGYHSLEVEQAILHLPQTCARPRGLGGSGRRWGSDDQPQKPGDKPKKSGD